MALAAASAAIRLADKLSEDKKRGYSLGAYYTEAVVLGQSRQNDDLALQKVEALLDLCNNPDDTMIRQAVQQLIADLRCRGGDAQSAVNFAQSALAVANGEPENVVFSKLALARALFDNAQTEEALKHACEAQTILKTIRVPVEANVQVLDSIADYASLLGDRTKLEPALSALMEVSDLSERIKKVKWTAIARSVVREQFRDRMLEFRNDPAPLEKAQTTHATNLSEANKLVVQPLLDLWHDLRDMGDAISAAYDFWGRGNLARVLLNARAFPHSFNVTLEVRTLEDVKCALRLWGIYADCLVLLWKGQSQNGLNIAPFRSDYAAPGGWGYQVCSGDVFKVKGSDKDWHPAMAFMSGLPHDVVSFLATDALPFVRAGRLFVVPAVCVACTSPGHGPFEQLLAETLNAVPSVRWKGVAGTAIGEVPYSPDAPFAVLADLAGNQEAKLRKLRLLLLKRSRDLRPDRNLELSAKELALEIDDALKDMMETYRSSGRKHGSTAQAETVNGSTAPFKINGHALSDDHPDSPYAPILILKQMGYGWSVQDGRVPKLPSRFEPEKGDVIGTWLAPPTSGWGEPVGIVG
ncbi:MAG: hypothetical protein B7Z37_04945 [Verrucomicrobia bacterium 12-59-8]|nr:MAG: hypothetical protein B7Z37_04945 [Verrucomicrobia bacterium 12-59-8]